MDEADTPILSYATPTRRGAERWLIAAWCVAIGGGLVAAALTWFSAVKAGPLVLVVAPTGALAAAFAASAVARRARVRFGLLTAAVQFVALLLLMFWSSGSTATTTTWIGYFTLVSLLVLGLPALVASMIMAIATLEPPPESPRDRGRRG